MVFRYTNGQNADFINLCELLDISLEEIAGAVIDRTKYTQYNTLEKIHDVYIAYEGNIPVACAGFRSYEKGVAEVKRVFVKNEYRGQGVSTKLMNHLENKASEKGYSTLILETGAPLVQAMGLYKKLGYKIIDNFGPYKHMKASICMQKHL